MQVIIFLSVAEPMECQGNKLAKAADPGGLLQPGQQEQLYQEQTFLCTIVFLHCCKDDICPLVVSLSTCLGHFK